MSSISIIPGSALSAMSVLPSSGLPGLPSIPNSGRPTAPAPSARPATMVRSGPIVALRERDTVALGTLRDRHYVVDDRLVAAHDRAGQSWWIPAGAVWQDADADGHPEHPQPIGLATATSTDRALLAGLSDRLGWEAVLDFERGADLPPAIGVTEPVPDDVIVLDGRMGHDVPTVVVMGSEFVRWSAAATWDGAVRRALYGDDGNPDLSIELEHITSVLGMRGLGVVAVDLDTPLLRRAGVVRCSVQLVASNGSGRAWYGRSVD